jgi:hypothetical protein
MNWSLALLTLLHLLVPIYWLGGDLGTFYSAGFMMDAKRPVNERLLALKIMNNIDMAPRTVLILTLPTGLSLAAAKGWVMVAPSALAGLWAAGLIWLALAWAVHLDHGPRGQKARGIDIKIRYAMILLLAGSGVAGLTGHLALPLFIACKLLVLAACVATGVVVRWQLVPLFPAIAAMKQHGPSPQSDAAILKVLGQTRPTVQGIWVLVLIASLLGIATPT